MPRFDVIRLDDWCDVVDLMDDWTIHHQDPLNYAIKDKPTCHRHNRLTNCYTVTVMMIMLSLLVTLTLSFAGLRSLRATQIAW